jgi:hypothetical protein
LGYNAYYNVRCGAYLCFEGYEKYIPCFTANTQMSAESEPIKNITPEEERWKESLASAVRTDIILSAEIMAISYHSRSNVAR